MKNTQKDAIDRQRKKLLEEINETQDDIEDCQVDIKNF